MGTRNCCKDFVYLLRMICEEALASMGSYCFLLREICKTLQDNMSVCSSRQEGTRQRVTPCDLLVAYFTHMHCDTVESIAAAQLHMTVDDVSFFLAEAREQ